MKRFLRSTVRVFAAVNALIITHIFLSYFIVPKLTTNNICIKDPRMMEPATLGAIKEVISTFNRHNINIKLGCKNSFTSMNLSYGDIKAPEILAQTWAHFIFIDLYAKQGKYEYPVSEIFIPLVHFYPLSVPIVFDDSYLPEDDLTTFKFTLIHEIGHALGAPHVFYDERNIMYPFIDVSVNQTLDSAVLQVKELTYWIQRYKK